METRQFSFVLPGTPSAVADARHRVLAQLQGWGLRPGSGVLDSIELATSELVTNAVQHAGSGGEPVAVDVCLCNGLVRIAVCDTNRDLPRLRLPGSMDEHGRGFIIVAAMAARFDFEPTPTGKRCWAEFEVPMTSADTQLPALQKADQ
ncbi:ATP-binding protein [Streptomyces sp. NPDC048636]|uniref:ATP-binding protein n=1 Tax=Streptomyces sp. NPDC048636 TaxID=3155762 RepID=UPI00344A62E7